MRSGLVSPSQRATQPGVERLVRNEAKADFGSSECQEWLS